MDQIIFLIAEYLGWLVALIYLICVWGKKKTFYIPFLSAAICGVIAEVAERTFHGTFPSGHASTFLALAIGASYFYPRVGGWLIALATIMSVARVLAGFHVWIDIVGGLALALVVSGFVHFLFRYQDSTLTGREQV